MARIEDFAEVVRVPSQEMAKDSHYSHCCFLVVVVDDGVVVAETERTEGVVIHLDSRRHAFGEEVWDS